MRAGAAALFTGLLLPVPGAAQAPAVDITVGAGGRVMWNGAALAGDAAIAAKLADAARATPKPALRLTPMQGVQSADIMHVLVLTQPFHYQISIVRPAPERHVYRD
jgi:hypothetical protein